MASEIEETRRTCCQEIKRKASEERTVTCCDVARMQAQVQTESDEKMEQSGRHTRKHTYVFMYMYIDNCMDSFYRGFTVMGGCKEFWW